jgi:hypothetical protein
MSFYGNINNFFFNYQILYAKKKKKIYEYSMKKLFFIFNMFLTWFHQI